MDKFLVDLVSPNNEIRQQRESEVDLFLKSDLDNFLKLLIEYSIAYNDQRYTTVGLVLFLNTCLKRDDLYRRANQETIKYVYEQLSNYINEKLYMIPKGCDKRIAEILAKIAIKDGKDSEFIEETINKWNDSNSTSKIYLLYCLEMIFEFSFGDEVIEAFLDSIVLIIKSGFETNDNNIMVATSCALGMLLGILKNESSILKLENSIIKMIRLLVEIIKCKDNDHGIKILGILDDFANFHPKSNKRNVQELFWVYNEIIKTNTIDLSIRISSVNNMSSIIKHSSKYVKETSYVHEIVFQNLFDVIVNEKLSDLEEDNDEINNDRNKKLSKQNISDVILECIDQINLSLGVKFTLDKFIGKIMVGLNSNDWRSQSAALDVLGILIEKANSCYSNDFENIGHLVIPHLKNNNLIVLYSALTCVGFLADEFTPKLQSLFGVSVLESVITIFQNCTNETIVIRAVSCLINFYREFLESEESDKYNDMGIDFEDILKTLSPYNVKLLECLSFLFEKSVRSNSTILLEEILSLISIISNLLKSEFRPFYNIFTEGIKKMLTVLNNQNSVEHKALKLKSLLIDTYGFLIISISDMEETFINDIKIIINFCDNELVTNNTDSPVIKSIVSLYITMIQKLKNKYPEIVQKGIELAIKYSPITVDIRLTDSTDENENNVKYQSMEVDLKLLGGKKLITIDHSAIELKVVSFECLYCCIKLTPELIKPDQICFIKNLALEHLSGIHSTALKVLSSKLIAKILNFISLNDTIETFQIFSKEHLKNTKTLIEKGKHEEVGNTLRKYLNCLKVVMNDEKVNTLKSSKEYSTTFSELALVIKDSLIMAENKKQKLAKEYKIHKVYDIDILEDYSYDKDEILVIDQVVMEIVGELLKLDNEFCFGVLNDCLSYFENILAKINKQDITKNEVLYSLCFLSDILERSNNNIFLEKLLSYININQIILNKFLNEYEFEQIAQTCAYLFGVASYRMSTETNENSITSILQTLYSLINNNKLIACESKEWLDNVVSAMFKLFLKHYKILATPNQYIDILESLIDKVPLSHDLIEANTLETILMKEYQLSNEFLVGSEQLKNTTLKLFSKISLKYKSNETNKNLIKANIEFYTSFN